MKSLKICIVSNDFPPNIVGGQGIYAYELAKQLMKMGHIVKVIASTNGSLVNEDFEVFSVKRKANPLHFSILAKKMFEKRIGTSIDVLHGNAIDHFAFCTGKPANINKIVTTTQNTYIQRFFAKSLKWKVLHPPLIASEKLVFDRSDRIIAVSEVTKKAILKYNVIDSKIDIVYNGVDIEKFSIPYQKGILRKKLGFKDVDIKLVLFVGRLVKRKNPDILLNACAKMIKQDPSIHCVFVGKGELEEPLRNIIKTNRLEKNAHILGFFPHDKLPAIYCDGDVLVLPSLGEGLPLSLLEAAATGLPLISTEEGSGCAPIIKNGENGFLCSIDEDDLVKKISLVFKNRINMGKASKAIVSKYFTWAQCASDTLGCYSKICLSSN